MTAFLVLALGFVQVHGPDFVLDGKPFHFVGANLRVMHGDNWRSHYVPVLDAAQSDGLAVGRIWALGEGEVDAEDWRRRGDLFRAGPTGWIEGAYVQLDRVLIAARKRGIRLIVTLSNHWTDYGGVPQYLRWIGLDIYSAFGVQDQFYQDPRARSVFAAHVERLLSRRNSIDGTAYVDEPAIFAWELMNESQVQSQEGRKARRDWIHWAAQLIKQRDRNHLVSAGLLGYRDLEERQDWIETLRVDGVDYCDAHLYPRDGLRVRTMKDLDNLVDDLAQLSRYVIGKPLVIGEFGFPVRERTFRGTPPAKWIAHLLERLREDQVAGSLIWIYQSEGTGDDYAIRIGDPKNHALRQVLARGGKTLSRPGSRGRPNPKLDPSRGAQPFLDFHVEVKRRTTPLRSWTRTDQGYRLSLQPQAFARAYWEQTGIWNEGVLIHAYGTKTGFFEYDFSAPPTRSPPRALELRIRLSSEYPGALSPPDGRSRVIVLIDNVQVAILEAFPDDSLGRWYKLLVREPDVLRKIGGNRIHRLRLEVKEGPTAHGLCIYGAAGKQGKRAEGAPAELSWQVF